MEFVGLDIEFWRWVLLVDSLGTVRKESGKWLTKVGQELGDREGDQ